MNILQDLFPLLHTRLLAFLFGAAFILAPAQMKAVADETTSAPEPQAEARQNLTPCEAKFATLPIHIFGSAKAQKKVELAYDETQTRYLLEVLLDALQEAEGFGNQGLNYVKLKLVYETDCACGLQPANCVPGLDEISVKYNLEEDEVRRRLLWFKFSLSHFPEEHPFLFGLGKNLQLVSEENYLSRTLNTLNANNENPEESRKTLKSITIYVPGSSARSIKDFLAGLTQRFTDAAITGTTAGIIAN